MNPNDPNLPQLQRIAVALGELREQLVFVGGSVAGTWLALKHGSAFVRRVFLGVVGVLIVKFAWDTYRLL